MTRELTLTIALVCVPLIGTAAADTTVPISGIGTSVSAEYDIRTRVESVTYSDPAPVTINGLPACEIKGTVTGVGWGGTGIVTRAVNAHYRYTLGFVARWRRDCPCQRLVFYAHGGGTSLMNAIVREKLAGAANPNRTSELNGDLLVGVPALLDQAAYISINRRGMRSDGAFSATYLPPMEPLTAAEVSALQAGIANAPGNPGFQQPGIEAGAAVPLVPTNDAATCRDVARALEQVVARLTGRAFCTRIGVGTSSGARLFAGMNFGRSVFPMSGARTGGNHVVPYDARSPKIFDGYVLIGFPFIAGVEHADRTMPFSAPTIFIQGQGDERYHQHVTMVHELLQKNVPLSGKVWIYEVKNLTHITRDITAETTNPSNGDRLGCFLSSAVANLRACLEQGVSPPRSRMAGRIIMGALRFDQVGGGTTNVAPIPNDPAHDAFVVDANLTPRTIGPAETDRWLAVTAALPHEADAITPPTVACRLGGYKLMFFGSPLVPFPPADLKTKFASFDNYRALVRQTIAGLERERLYDPRVESASATAELARQLFD